MVAVDADVNHRRPSPPTVSRPRPVVPDAKVSMPGALHWPPGGSDAAGMVVSVVDASDEAAGSVDEAGGFEAAGVLDAVERRDPLSATDTFCDGEESGRLTNTTPAIRTASVAGTANMNANARWRRRFPSRTTRSKIS